MLKWAKYSVGKNKHFRDIASLSYRDMSMCKKMNIVVAEREQIRLYTYLIYLQYKNLRKS